MRILTVFSTILMPFLIVSSIYGMNVFLPGGQTPGTTTSFWVIMGLMLAFTGGLLWYFRKRRWI
jgi:LPXTG-motif cell wall-anchored protein